MDTITLQVFDPVESGFEFEISEIRIGPGTTSSSMLLWLLEAYFFFYDFQASG